MPTKNSAMPRLKWLEKCYKSLLSKLNCRTKLSPINSRYRDNWGYIDFQMEDRESSPSISIRHTIFSFLILLPIQTRRCMQTNAKLSSVLIERSFQAGQMSTRSLSMFQILSTVQELVLHSTREESSLAVPITGQVPPEEKYLALITLTNTTKL